MVDVLKSINAEDFKCTVFRLHSATSIKDFAKDQTEDIEYIDQLFEDVNMPKHYRKKFDGSKTFEVLLLDSLFKIPKQLPKKFPGRFSDGMFSVLYSALDKKTAEAEACYWHCRLFVRGVKRQKKIHRVLFSCEFSGPTKDLRSFSCPKLIQDDDVADGYQFCRQLGREAVDEGLHGLLAPSARRQGGTNLPVFERKALSNLRLGDHFNIVYDPNKKSSYTQKRDL